jgi:hypothetical protein
MHTGHPCFLVGLRKAMPMQIAATHAIISVAGSGMAGSDSAEGIAEPLPANREVPKLARHES